MSKRLLNFALVLIAFGLSVAELQAQHLYTVAGDGRSSEALAPLEISVTPGGVVVDGIGNIYFVDLKHHSVRKYDIAANRVNTIAGGNGPGFSGDGGPAIGAMLNNPNSIALDADGKTLYIGDKDNNRIRKVDLFTETIRTFAGKGTSGYTGNDGPATEAGLSISGIHVDGSGNLYVAESEHNIVRKIDHASGIISTVAGNGTSGNAGDGGAAVDAMLNSPSSVCTDASGNLYVVDPFNNNIRKVDASGNITTFAGTGTSGFTGDGGPAIDAQVSFPGRIAADANGNVYVADRGNKRIRMIGTDGVINTVVGMGGAGSLAENIPATDAYTDPLGIALNPQGDLVIAENGIRIRQVTSSSGMINTIIGNGSSGYGGDGGPAMLAQLNGPSAVVKHTDGNIYIADYGNSSIRKIDALTSTITTIAGNGEAGFSADGTLASDAQFRSPIDLAVDANNNIYVVERSTNRIRKIDAVTGKLSTVAGTGTDGFSGDGGPATSAMLSNPLGICVDADGDIFITDNNRIRKIDAATRVITTIAGTGPYGFSGDGGPATQAMLYRPARLAADKNGNIYFSDWYNHRIRKIDKGTGIISTVAGNGSAGYSGDDGLATAAQLNYPLGVSVDDGGNIYIADTQNSRIRKVDVSTGMITTITGTGAEASSPDGTLASAASVDDPEGVSVDAEGRLYFADSGNDAIKVVKPKGALFKFSNTVAIYSGSGISVGLASDPDNINATITYDGAATLPVNAGRYEVHAVSKDAQYQGEGWATLTITKAPQTITFDPIGPKALPDGGFDLTAISDSGLPVSYSVTDPNIATVEGNRVTLLATGTTTITANVAADANHFPGESVVRTLEVVQESKAMTITGSLAFGDVPVDETAQAKITVANSGTAMLRISGISLPEGFVSDVSIADIAPGGSLDITISFQPKQEMSYNGKMVVVSDATSGSNEVDITGTGITVTGIGDEVTKSRRIEIYPNPSTGVFFLRSVSRDINIVQILDMSGRVVDTIHAVPANETEYMIDVRHLDDDAYLLFIPATREFSRVVKQSE